MLKLKQCYECKEDRVIYKRVNNLPYCKICYFKLNKPKPINKVSDKRKEKNKEYSLLRIQALKKYPICQICKVNPSTDIHHTYNGPNRDKYMNDISTWMILCRKCHDMITFELPSELLIELGYKKRI